MTNHGIFRATNELWRKGLRNILGLLQHFMKNEINDFGFLTHYTERFGSGKGLSVTDLGKRSHVMQDIGFDMGTSNKAFRKKFGVN